MSSSHHIKIVSYVEVPKKAIKCFGITPHASVYKILRNYVEYRYEKTERGNVRVNHHHNPVKRMQNLQRQEEDLL